MAREFVGGGFWRLGRESDSARSGGDFIRVLGEGGGGGGERGWTGFASEPIVQPLRFSIFRFALEFLFSTFGSKRENKGKYSVAILETSVES